VKNPYMKDFSGHGKAWLFIHEGITFRGFAFGEILGRV
jgi:hypothetical protein